ncbi:hypothetical protein [Microbacterium sp. KNMS]
MAKIRDDFEGITIVRVGTVDKILKAGDKVPKGVTVGDHLLAPKGTDAEPAQEPQEPAGDQTGDTGTGDQGTGDEGAQTALTAPPKAGAGSGTDVWRAYAVEAVKANGLNVEIPEGATRADIIEALEAAQIPTE